MVFISIFFLRPRDVMGHPPEHLFGGFDDFALAVFLKVSPFQNSSGVFRKNRALFTKMDLSRCMGRGLVRPYSSNFASTIFSITGMVIVRASNLAISLRRKRLMSISCLPNRDCADDATPNRRRIANAASYTPLRRLRHHCFGSLTIANVAKAWLGDVCDTCWHAGGEDVSNPGLRHYLVSQIRAPSGNSCRATSCLAIIDCSPRRAASRRFEGSSGSAVVFT